MAAIYNAWMPRKDGQQHSIYDWLPDEERPQPKAPWGTQTEQEKRFMLRSLLHDQACIWAAKNARDNPEVQAQLDVMESKDWMGATDAKQVN